MANSRTVCRAEVGSTNGADVGHSHCHLFRAYLCSSPIGLRPGGDLCLGLRKLIHQVQVVHSFRTVLVFRDLLFGLSLGFQVKIAVQDPTLQIELVLIFLGGHLRLPTHEVQVKDMPATGIAQSACIDIKGGIVGVGHLTKCTTVIRSAVLNPVTIVVIRH